ncbi:hypothetical protein KAX03_01130 [Candidatus Bathyarchaeota archaeon]|nr:hypothetical protein [Candidatus Bathyarchaeota archaeon]
MPDTLKNWDRDSNTSLLRSIKEKIIKPSPLKERLSYAIYRLQMQMNKLEQVGTNMQHQYDLLFKKCTDAVMSKDMQRARIYANECAQIKKMVSVILQSQFAIERVTMRLRTVEEFGDVAIEMGPVANVISSLKGQLIGILPEVSYGLGEIGESLNEMVMGFGETTGMSEMHMTSSEEASKILNEAAAVAENKMRERFPTLPGTPVLDVEKESESKFTT